MRAGALLVLVVAGFALPGAAASPAVAASWCHSLAVTPRLDAQLRAVHLRHVVVASGPRRGSSHYGRCGHVYYALAAFYHPRVGYTDQPEIFRRATGRRWRDLGESGGEPCSARMVPRPLLRSWRIGCS